MSGSRCGYRADLGELTVGRSLLLMSAFGWVCASRYLSGDRTHRRTHAISRDCGATRSPRCDGSPPLGIRPSTSPPPQNEKKTKNTSLHVYTLGSARPSISAASPRRDWCAGVLWIARQGDPCGALFAVGGAGLALTYLLMQTARAVRTVVIYRYAASGVHLRRVPGRAASSAAFAAPRHHPSAASRIGSKASASAAAPNESRRPEERPPDTSRDRRSTPSPCDRGDVPSALELIVPQVAASRSTPRRALESRSRRPARAVDR